jgi:hypothetical protein
MSKIGPYSRPHTIAKLDGRTKEARLMRAVRRELTAHVGGAPSATEMMMIEQAAQLRLHLALIDRKVAEGREMTPHDSRQYLAWSNALSRLLRHLGPRRSKTSARRLADHLAERAAQ